MVLLSLEKVKKSFGEIHAIDDVNLEIDKGLISIIGPNGAGKTTLVNVISGTLFPDEGKIMFERREITKKPMTERVKMGIARSYQLVQLFGNLTVYDNIRACCILRKNLGMKLLSSVKKFKSVSEECEEICERFLLSDKKDMLARDLPHGDKKLLDVAIAYALRPKILLLDEPTSGLSVYERNRVMDIITSTVKKDGITTVIVEHDMDIVFNYSDRIIVMHEGKIIADGKPEEVEKLSLVKSLVMGG